MEREPTAEELGSATGGCSRRGGWSRKCSRHRRVTTFYCCDIQAQLEVYEGQSHAQYLFDDRLPETAVAFGEIAEFFDKHLGK